MLYESKTTRLSEENGVGCLRRGQRSGVMTLSNRPSRFLIRIHPVAVGRAAAQTRGRKKRAHGRGREAPMIYSRHYGPDNYMLPYGRPLVHVARKERERIGR